tara:strand:- start:5970 stop:7649 length:1680 start_codon:yes stop_codon:yes gene_type:complete
MEKLEQKFLSDLDDKLWKSADKLRANLDAANYKHIVLGLIFLKYVSDSFEERQEELLEQFKDESDDIYYLPPEDYDSDEDYQLALREELEVLDYYREANVFWVPKAARWSTLKEKAVLPVGTVIWQDEAGNDVKLRSVSWLIDNALEEIEKSNTKLKGILNRISQYQLENDKLIGLINTFSDTSFTKPVFKGEKLSLHSKDILGHVYEYFLGQFALAEGKQGGQYYTPKSIVTLIVELLEPYSGRVYDPAMGSGGFFVSSDRFIEEHAKEQHYDAEEQKKHISVYGQESNPTTWKLAAMNMAIRGIDFTFGKKNADTFLDDQHPDLRADFVMANPPFNMKEWWHESLNGDVRWKFGEPAKSNANYAWLQHIFHHLSTNGKAAILLSNGSLTSNTSEEFIIRKNLVDSNCLDCIIALPTHLFTNTQIGACIWILSKRRSKEESDVLFIDAKSFGTLETKVFRSLSAEEIKQISETYRAWKKNDGYSDILGYSKSASTEEIAKHKYALVPGRYVGFDRREFVSASAKEQIFKNISSVSKRIDDVIDASRTTRDLVEGFING